MFLHDLHVAAVEDLSVYCNYNFDVFHNFIHVSWFADLCLFLIL